MTQPPEEQQPEEQPPEPPPPRPPAPGQNPYGGPQQAYYKAGGMPSGLKTGLGVLVGLFGGFFLWVTAAIAFTSASGDTTGFLLFTAVAPLVLPAILLVPRATRPWAVGLLIGTAVTSIGLSSVCSTLVSGGVGG